MLGGVSSDFMWTRPGWEEKTGERGGSRVDNHILTPVVSQIGQEEDTESDIFSIKEVSFQATGDSEWRDTNYTLNTDSLDWALYDHLMDFLEDRGIDNTFADELVELSTALEHQEYITFLEDLKSFVKSQ